ncbi:alkaline phosphatase D family protein [Mariniblastus fucicola]|uniref:PhoD-like phosphatase n=1 Tax=Mariniblastus fucicola TaxID=980251 RepID=A0A5B9PB50_9BACT|nr:alkaline phosphatase D family protein [Mariniblastus fucicola]QEG23568.1 PhoD-like phosphatase [Mariniblastus fucicola]
MRFVLVIGFFCVLLSPLCKAQSTPGVVERGHAHNDYRHDRPFWDAYDHGFCSIEVDIYRSNDKLLVAHDVAELLQHPGTLQELYLDPLREVVGKNGGRVYPNGPETITLLIDIKNDGRDVFPLLKETLAQYKDMLCCVENDAYQKRAVQVVISGDRPKELIGNDPDRLMSIDGRMSDLESELSPELMPLISDRWSSHFKWRGEGEMPDSERQKLQDFVATAHASGRKVRLWATPESTAVWSELLAADVDMINTDQLENLKTFLANAANSTAETEIPDTVTRIGMIGCHRQDRPAPAFNRYYESSPDVMVWMGDNVYADTKNDITFIEKCYQRMASQVAFEKLRESIPFVVTWDDHDYGLNNAGKNYPLKDESRKLFRKFWEMEEFIPEDRDGIYHARYFGSGETRLQMIMLDTRYNRDDEGDASDTLGENQWTWLESELRKPAKIRLIASGYQVLLDRDQKFETWSKFPAAKKRLFDLIQMCEAEGVIFLAGDQHYGEVSRLPKALGYDAVEFMFAGINQEEQHVFNSHRVSPVAHALNSYPLIDIQWQPSEIDPPHVMLRCYDADTNKLALSYRVNFSELQRVQQRKPVGKK